MLIADGKECGEVDCGIVVSRNRGVVSGYGRIDGDRDVLMAASDADDVELRLAGGKPLKIDVVRFDVMRAFADVATSGPIPDF